MTFSLNVYIIGIKHFLNRYHKIFRLILSIFLLLSPTGFWELQPHPYIISND